MLDLNTYVYFRDLVQRYPFSLPGLCLGISAKNAFSECTCGFTETGLVDLIQLIEVLFVFEWSRFCSLKTLCSVSGWLVGIGLASLPTKFDDSEYFSSRACQDREE